jgi:filamentous hemagglutinin family protein
MLFQYLYFWQLSQINELKYRDKYSSSRLIYLLDRLGSINTTKTVRSADFSPLLFCGLKSALRTLIVAVNRPDMMLFSILYLCLFPVSAIAQIIPDSTLGAESSRLVPDTINNLPSDRITGGATRGSNLFHSFREFNIGEGRGAYFANPNGIANIFTRVTGGNPSNILGTLGVQGNANLFLINPRGLIFGQNARLDLRGSFIGSTADSIVFNNGFEFSSTTGQTSPLLTVNIPVGLRFRDNSGTIVNQSTATGTVNLPATRLPIPIAERVGLAVDNGQTLALIGGEIQIAGGNLTASGGQILLGSTASPGLVNFAQTGLGINFNYSNIQNFGNIELSAGSAIDTSGVGGGKVDIRGGNVTISNSRIYGLTLGNIDSRGIDITAQNVRVKDGSKISTLTLGNGAGGNINIRATDSVEMSGLGLEGYQQLVSKYLASGTVNPFDPQFVLFNGSSGAGSGGSITIDTGSLVMRNGVVGSGITLGAGSGGSLNIRANTYEMVGSGINNATAKDSTGAGGSINLDVERLIMRDGSLLGSTSYSSGPSGSINVKAAESIELSNSSRRTAISTGISTLSIGGNGKAGDINVDTKRLSLADGSAFTLGTGILVGFLFSRNGGPAGNLTVRASESVEIAGISPVLTSGNQTDSALSSATLSSSRAGNIRVDTSRLTVRNGGLVSTRSFGTGDGGDITINADRILVSSINSNGLSISSIDASVGSRFVINNPNPTANAGSVNLNTRQLSVRDGATVTVQARGTGRAGNINVVADAIALDNKGSIDGRSASGVGANINLQARDIQLRRGSRITTDAGNSDGGNININSGILVALPQENSDITANARTAGGGRVNVNVPNVLGFTAAGREQVRSRLNLSDAQFAALQVSPTSLLESSDIAAISQSGGPALQGTVTFSSSGVNPAQGLVELPQNVVNPAALIAANPCVEGADNEFTVTGRGGVPPNPNDSLSNAETPFPWIEIEEQQRSQKSEVKREEAVRRKSEEIRREEGEKTAREVVAARGWVVNEKGDVTLVAAESAGQFPQRTRHPMSVCQPR